MFALAGWLFADMFLGMTMIFLVASGIGKYDPDTTTITPTPQLRGMDKVPVIVKFSVDMKGLLNNDPAVVAQVQSQVQNQLQGYLSNHVSGKAALVSTFGGGINDNLDATEASNVNAILQSMGRQQHYVFDRSDTIYDNYIDRGANYGEITIYVYFFLYS